MLCIMMMVRMISSDGHIISFTCPLWREFTCHRWIPLTRSQSCKNFIRSLFSSKTSCWTNTKHGCYFGRSMFLVIRENIVCAGNHALLLTMLILYISPWPKWHLKSLYYSCACPVYKSQGKEPQLIMITFANLSHIIIYVLNHAMIDHLVMVALFS